MNEPCHTSRVTVDCTRLLTDSLYLTNYSQTLSISRTPHRLSLSHELLTHSLYLTNSSHTLSRMNEPCHTSCVTLTNDPEIHPHIYIRAGEFHMTYASCHNHTRPVSQVYLCWHCAYICVGVFHMMYTPCHNHKRSVS